MPSKADVATKFGCERSVVTRALKGIATEELTASSREDYRKRQKGRGH